MIGPLQYNPKTHSGQSALDSESSNLSSCQVYTAVLLALYLRASCQFRENVKEMEKFTAQARIFYDAIDNAIKTVALSQDLGMDGIPECSRDEIRRVRRTNDAEEMPVPKTSYLSCTCNYQKQLTMQLNDYGQLPGRRLRCRRMNGESPVLIVGLVFHRLSSLGNSFFCERVYRRSESVLFRL